MQKWEYRVFKGWPTEDELNDLAYEGLGTSCGGGLEVDGGVAYHPEMDACTVRLYSKIDNSPAAGVSCRRLQTRLRLTSLCFTQTLWIQSVRPPRSSQFRIA